MVRIYQNEIKSPNRTTGALTISQTLCSSLSGKKLFWFGAAVYIDAIWSKIVPRRSNKVIKPKWTKPFGQKKRFGVAKNVGLFLEKFCSKIHEISRNFEVSRNFFSWIQDFKSQFSKTLNFCLKMSKNELFLHVICWIQDFQTIFKNHKFRFKISKNWHFGIFSVEFKIFSQISESFSFASKWAKIRGGQIQNLQQRENGNYVRE